MICCYCKGLDGRRDDPWVPVRRLGDQEVWAHQSCDRAWKVKQAARDAQGKRIDHLQTIIAIVICTICVTLATPIVRIVVIVGGIISGVAGWADWLPEGLDYYLIKVPIDLLVSTGTGYLAMIITAGFVRRADVSIVAYVVATIYLCIFLGLMAIIYFIYGQTPNELLSQTAQLIGIIAGLAIGREQILQDNDPVGPKQ